MAASLQELVANLRLLTPEQLNEQHLGQIVDQLDISALDYQEELKAEEATGSYCRIPLLLEPMECTLICWPPGSESSVHHHVGFWGYVLVLEGNGVNVEYSLSDKLMQVSSEAQMGAGHVLHEEEGVIHKICNGSEKERMVTLHLYYPALQDLSGMKIFDLEEKRIGVFNERAKAFSWKEPEAHFEKIIEDAFEVAPV